MAGDYIRREAELFALRKAERGGSMTALTQLERAYAEIREMPAADVAEVVRCKDCKWFADNNGGEWYGCKMFHVVRITPEDAPKPDDFCSYGEYLTNIRGSGNVSD
jgi:hypothetical protein